MLVTSVFFVLGALFVTWLIFPKVEYLPNGNRNLVFGIILPPPGYNLAKLREMGTILKPLCNPIGICNRMSRHLMPRSATCLCRIRTAIVPWSAASDPLRASELTKLVTPLNAKLEGGFILLSRAVCSSAVLPAAAISTSKSLALMWKNWCNSVGRSCFR